MTIWRKTWTRERIRRYLGFSAILDADDENHRAAKQAWVELITQEANLICTNYVLVESFVLVRRRLGMAALRSFQEDIVSMLRIEWTVEAIHRAGVTALLIAANRRLSLVDCVSFETMRSLGIQIAFAFDRHFSEQGFECIPPYR